jgi:hypothetical protein
MFNEKPMQRTFLGDKHFILANTLKNLGENIMRNEGKSFIELRNICL